MAIEAGQSGALAANIGTGNVLAGRTYEYVPRSWRRGANLRFAALGALAASLNCTQRIKIDTQIIADDSSIPYAPRAPVIPDDVQAVHWAAPGARVFWSFNAGAAGAAAPGINWKMDMEPA